MNMRLSMQGLYVDPVLGWAARLNDAETAGARRPATDGQARPVRMQDPDKPRAEGDDT